MRKIILMMPVSAGSFIVIIGIFGRIGGSTLCRARTRSGT
jgi:hypothetical protein